MSTAEASKLDIEEPYQHTAVASPEVEKIPESVIALLMDRKERGYRRGIDDDGHKIGLTFDPGAYAGVISLAMGRKLEVAGLLDYVDAFYGLSAGGVNAAYAATGQIKEGMDTYVNLMPDNGLLQTPGIKPPKSLKMDLDVLRDAVYRDHPLKIKELVESKVPVVIGVTDLSDPFTPAKMFKSTEANPEHPESFIEQMMMGCNLPVIAGGPMKGEDGHLYTDATLAWSTSVELAIADGCTEVLSLANFPPVAAEAQNLGIKTLNFAAGFAGNRYLENKRPEWAKQTIREQGLPWKLSHPLRHLTELIMGYDEYVAPKYSETLSKMQAAEANYSEGLFVENGVTVERIYPPDLPGLPELLTADKNRLRIGIKAGRLAVRRALSSISSRQNLNRPDVNTTIKPLTE